MQPSKLKAQARIEAARTQLIALSHQIHAHPELAWEEVQASTWLTALLNEAGFRVERSAGGLPTAFVARTGTGPLQLAFCAEYDALPGLGHACGHNIIAASSVGAALGLAEVAEELALTVVVVGSPAEEVADGGGKIRLLEGGAFSGIHAAMLVHPAPVDVLAPPLTAAAHFVARYTGRAAQAAVSPETGVNAADALVIAQVAIGLLRQQLRPTEKVFGVTTKAGESATAIPAAAEASYFVRAPTVRDVESLRDRVLRCFEAGSVATGAALQVSGGLKPYAEMHHDPAITALYRANAEALGRSFPEIPPELLLSRAACTDLGNVSRAVPSIHPYIGLQSWPASNHQPEFAAHCVTPAADKAIVDAAIALSWTAIDVATDQALRARLLGTTCASP